MAPRRTTPLHVLVGSKEEHKQLDDVARNNGSVSWYAPKSALKGDWALLFFGNAVCGAGVLEEPVGEHEGEGRYSSMVGNLHVLKKPVSASDLIAASGDQGWGWNWPTYPRSYTTVRKGIADKLIEFVRQRSGTDIRAVFEDTGAHVRSANVRDRAQGVRRNDREPLDDDDFDPEDREDARERIERMITQRQGQPAFRRKLMEAYGRRCAISGCPCEDVLDAAHILAYKGEKANHIQNGLLLRTDLHTLFDRHRLAVNPDGMLVVIDPAIRDPAYRHFDGNGLSLPRDSKQQPSKEALREHLRQCSFVSKK